MDINNHLQPTHFSDLDLNPAHATNRQFARVINSVNLSEEEKIRRVKNLIDQGWCPSSELIYQCEEMYGISPELKEILEKNKSD